MEKPKAHPTNSAVHQRAFTQGSKANRHADFYAETRLTESANARGCCSYFASLAACFQIALKRKWNCHAVALLILSLGSQAITAADPILLGETATTQLDDVWSGGVALPKTIIGMQFYIGAERPLLDADLSAVDEIKLAQTVGGNLFLTNGQTGIYDFYPSNSPAFSNVKATLTDGTNGTFSWGVFGYNSDRKITGGRLASGTESGIWGLSSGYDFKNHTITFFRLNISYVYWGRTGISDFRIAGIGKWQVYGFPPVAPPLQPELRIDRTVLNAVLVSWPTQSIGFVLQSGSEISSAMTNIPIMPVTVGTNSVVLLPTSNSRAFFRLVYSP